MAALPSFLELPIPVDAAPRRYTDAPTTVSIYGYVFEWCPTHPKAQFGSIQQHRLIMECAIGRFLIHPEIVHHKNGIRRDNRLENLELLASQAEHGRLHPWCKRRDPKIIEQVRLAAENRMIPFAQLDVSQTTAIKICRENGIKWQRRYDGPVDDLTEQSVRAALLGRTTRQAALLLGVHPQTLYNRYDYLLNKRAKPGSLDQHIREVIRLAYQARIPLAEIGKRYGVSETCVQHSLQRWKRQTALKPGAKSGAVALLYKPRPRCKLGPKRKAPHKA